MTLDLTQAQERRGTDAHALLWLRARNRNTGATEEIGFWTGDDHRTFTIGGQARLYYGAGAVIGVNDVRATVGQDVHYHQIVLPPVLDEVQQALRAYEPRLAEVEVHLCGLDIDSGDELFVFRMVKGQLNEAPEEIAEEGGESGLELMVASAARRGTFGLPLLRSNEQLKRRAAGDRFREYSDVAGDWRVPWGEEARDD